MIGQNGMNEFSYCLVMLGQLLGNACAFSRSWNEFTFILVDIFFAFVV